MEDQQLTNKKESGFEDVIYEYLTQQAGYRPRVDSDYLKEFSLDGSLLESFLQATQPEKVEKLRAIHKELFSSKVLGRISAQIRAKGVIEVLRKGVDDMGVHLDLLFPKPTSGRNQDAENKYNNSVLSVIRQVHFSLQSNESVDLVLFVNGIPVLTIELKNPLSGQKYEDAIWQYRRDRSPREELFSFSRCMVHFAMDSEQVFMSTDLKGDRTVFLPFNKGNNGEAGNPQNPNGYKTSYMWEEVFAKDSLLNIIENFASRVEERDEDTGIVKIKQIFPRYHQLDVVRKLLTDAKTKGVGKRYLIQHSAGSGKSNSITWLAHQLVELHDGTDQNLFDSVIVVTDRKVLDQQIRNNIKQFAQVDGVVEAITEGSQHLKKALEAGKKIIITTVQKFPYIAESIVQLPSHRFALVIDEAHSSQSGETSRTISMALHDRSAEYGEQSLEDTLNELVESKKLLPNASYFAFTATPKNKTLELFGEKREDGTFVPFHVYSMRQATQEGFILDVLKNYTTYHTYYNLIKRVENDPEFDKKVARKMIYRFLQLNPDTIEKKLRIMIEHFTTNVAHRIGGNARAMIVAGSRKAAVEYYLAFKSIMAELHLPYKAIVAYTGDIDGQSEDQLNGFPVTLKTVKKKLEGTDGYKFLIVAEKFQTGFDEPLLHTMYVDKILSGVTAVQTLSRINRVMPPQKADTFVLDFVNSQEDIKASFEPYYKVATLSEETDPNKLFDLKDSIMGSQICTNDEITEYVTKILSRRPITELHPLLDIGVGRFNQLDLESKFKAKGEVKSFIRLYAYLSQIAPFESIELEKLYIYLVDLNKKLEIDVEHGPVDDLISSIDLDSIRVQQSEKGGIELKGDAMLEPIPPGGGGGATQPEIDRLSAILKEMNERFGGIDFGDADKVKRTFAQIADDVRNDPIYQKATQNSDRQNSMITFQKLLNDKFQEMISVNFNLYKKYSDDPDFKRYMADRLFDVVWQQAESLRSDRLTQQTYQQNRKND